ncbi:BTAD domain-containing putative transcriptional regulator [Amycolatopsis endophytica]|uniref:Putative ATPase/DNA-binding winged helix-turn-helix (WHTH) protein n=1 Tax=Amycolatopsis endophytica TaxID=860233 RepID=A0A853AW03_9PSEU|nr:BTAD domain-containing putative transcriptional regulator [Amycolatopsis endophytica]NYI86828.1 putative ATPase/DNA-binding winged helix-turn-helix (wHTH) protein [Amycolatopsis endophytica]
MWFAILGPVEARSAAGNPVPLGGPRPRSLLALLLLDAGHVIGTGRLIDGLYGDDPPGDAANALQAQVSRLRRKLGDEARIESHPAGYRLTIEPDRVDAHRFTRLAREGRAALDANEHAHAAKLLHDALGLWRGPALADVLEAPFAEAQAVRLDALRIAAIEDRAEADLALGDSRSVIGELTDLCAAHPLRERLRVLLMRALAANGRHAEALAVFEDARRTLADELGADPSPELASAHLALLRAEPPPEPPRIPSQLTSFIGRRRELDTIATLLDTNRLVTLTGPGGAGKTRLSLETGVRVDGEVCFVDFAPVTSGTDVSQAALAALGLRETALFPASGAAPDPVGRIEVALTGRPMLLIFDNCEHVVTDAARLAHRLLTACPGLRVLATSREPLGITGEALCPVPPLESPPPGASPAEAADYPSVRLFTERAAAVRPGFHLDDDSTERVLRICGALDGLPLAIELAAARLRTLSLDQLEARLDDRFRLLSRGSRTAAPRHQTLRAVVSWSWDLLEPDERDLARRLAVFTGGATGDAIARVCGLSEPDTEDLLDGLVDKSLVECSAGRYRMLETIRAFSAEQLDESGERDELARAHAEYFLDFARTADSYLRRAEQVEWLARLTAERANLHAALRWSIDVDTRLALRLVGALSSYWRMQGVRTEIAPLAARLLAGLPAEPPGDLAEEYALCVLNAAPTGPPGLDEHLRRVESIMSSLTWPVKQPYLLVYWAMFAGPPSPTDWARELGGLERELTGTEDPWFQALWQFSTSYVRLYNGHLEGAEEAFRASLALFREVGDRWGIAQTLDGFAALADLRGEPDRSLALIDEAMELLGRLNATEELAELWYRRGDRLLRDGDLTDAETAYHRAAELARRSGALTPLAMANRGFGELARHRGHLAEAREYYEQALREVGTDWQADAAGAQILSGLGRLAEAEGDPGQARARHRQALDATLAQHFRTNIADAVEGLAGATLLDGDAGEAAGLLGMAVALRGMAYPGDQDVAAVAAGCQKLLGADAFATVYDRAVAMPYEDIVQHLRSHVA